MDIDKKVFRNLSYGVYIVTSIDDDKMGGCVINSAMQITSEKPTIAISVNHNNYTNKLISASGKFALTILKEVSDISLIGKFGYTSSKDTNKFQDVDFEMVDDVPVIKDSCGSIICRVIDKMETDTHTVFLGEVLKTLDYSDDTPMTYKYYHEVKKGKSPKNAPTYIQEETKGTPVYVCDVCGYEYEGDMPDNFVCPICGQGKEHFKLKD